MPHLDERLAGLPEPGETFMGKYRIARLIGMGGMGAVLEAEHLQMGERVAIKFLLGGAARPDRVERFSREASIAGKIKSDHIARVMDVGTAPSGDSFMVMEFLEGEDLLHILRRGRLPIPTAVDYILQAAEPLSEAHRLEIVHRDLKPANLFVTRTPDGSDHVKLLDFGISKLATSSLNLTKTSALLGSPLYMAPEQLTSTKSTDLRADIWALGVILFQMVSEVLPFAGDSLPEICTRVLYEAPRRLREVLPTAPAALDAAIARMLMKKREQRFADLCELAEALAPVGGESSRRSLAYVHGVLRSGSKPNLRLEPVQPAWNDDVPTTSDATTDRMTKDIDVPSGDDAPDPAERLRLDVTVPTAETPDQPLPNLHETLRSSGDDSVDDDGPTRRIDPAADHGVTLPIKAKTPSPPALTSTMIMAEEVPRPPEVSDAATADPVWRPAPPRSRNSAATGIVAVALVTLVVGGGVAVWLGSQQEPAPDPGAVLPAAQPVIVTSAVEAASEPAASSTGAPAVSATQSAPRSVPRPRWKAPRPKPSSLLDEQF